MKHALLTDSTLHTEFRESYKPPILRYGLGTSDPQQAYKLFVVIGRDSSLECPSSDKLSISSGSMGNLVDSTFGKYENLSIINPIDDHNVTSGRDQDFEQTWSKVFEDLFRSYVDHTPPASTEVSEPVEFPAMKKLQPVISKMLPIKKLELYPELLD